jgi:hypothetical protein
MTAEIQLPDVPLRDLEQKWGLSRNGLKARARALGVELKRISSTLTVWPGDFVDLGDQLDAHLGAGKPMGTFPALAPTDGTTANTASSITKASGVNAEGLALAIAQAMAKTTLSLPVPPIDPLRRARGLAEAADAGLVLTTDELVSLGVKGVKDFANGDEAFGYCFTKHEQRNRVLWTIARTIGKPATAGNVTAMTGQARIGFGAIEARYQTIVSAIELPQF